MYEEQGGMQRLVFSGEYKLTSDVSQVVKKRCSELWHLECEKLSISLGDDNTTSCLTLGTWTSKAGGVTDQSVWDACPLTDLTVQLQPLQVFLRLGVIAHISCDVPSMELITWFSPFLFNLRPNCSKPVSETGLGERKRICMWSRIRVIKRTGKEGKKKDWSRARGAGTDASSDEGRHVEISKEWSWTLYTCLFELQESGIREKEKQK